jgi:hypothetical protein
MFLGLNIGIELQVCNEVGHEQDLSAAIRSMARAHGSDVEVGLALPRHEVAGACSEGPRLRSPFQLCQLPPTSTHHRQIINTVHKLSQPIN